MRYETATCGTLKTAALQLDSYEMGWIVEGSQLAAFPRSRASRSHRFFTLSLNARAGTSDVDALIVANPFVEDSSRLDMSRVRQLISWLVPSANFVLRLASGNQRSADPGFGFLRSRGR